MRRSPNCSTTPQSGLRPTTGRRYSLAICRLRYDSRPVTAIPRLSMKLSIQLYLAELSLSNTVFFLEVLVLIGFDRPFTTGFTKPIYSRKLAETRITWRLVRPRFNWTVNSIGCMPPSIDSDDLLHTKLEPTKNVIADQFFSELRGKHDVDDAIFLVGGAVPLHRACDKHGLDFRYEKHGNRNSDERVFYRMKRENTSFSNCFSNAEAELLTSGSDRSASHGISLSEHYRDGPLHYLVCGRTASFAAVQDETSLGSRYSTIPPGSSLRSQRPGAAGNRPLNTSGSTPVSVCVLGIMCVRLARASEPPHC